MRFQDLKPRKRLRKSSNRHPMRDYATEAIGAFIVALLPFVLIALAMLALEESG